MENIFYNGKYCDFFDIDEEYFPCIDDSAIDSGKVDWTKTFPHKTFVDMLKNAERMLSGNGRSLWIHGSYGTGKSMCAYALKKILEVANNELQDYWNSYDNLKNNPELLTKILGHKERGILTCYRYASGNITTPRDLFFAIQETIIKSLNDGGYNIGANGLKESVIRWLSEPTHKNFFDSLLKKEKWASLFSQSTTDEVISTLKGDRDVKDLIDNIFELASAEGITAMNLDADILKDWIKDVIRKNNNLKIVFIWDEFSGFFKQNRNSLDEFQKVVSLCQDVPFYLVVVTHQTESLINSTDQSWKVVQQRFEFTEITLPPNIAFELIGAAMKIKETTKVEWEELAGSLNSGLSDSRREVMKAANLTNPKVIKDIMPLHPMAALVLKNIASSFKSNQRSMFDFIKTNNHEVHAFQWFVNNTRPIDQYPLLTIDMLWDFFYEKGRDNLTSDIRMILDTYSQQKNLRDDEQRVLKTILIMQAIDKRIGGEIELLKPTEQNITYAFEGSSELSGTKCVNIARNLKNRGVLVLTPIGDNKFAYGAAVLAGDQSEIDKNKESIRQNVKTINLINEGELSTVLSLSAPLKLRFAEEVSEGTIMPVTNIDFTRTMNSLKNRTLPWHFNTVIAFAKDKDEAIAFRKVIKEAAYNEEYKDIVIIDALSTPLEETDFNNYVEFAAMALYHNTRNRQSADENARKAKTTLAISWKNKIYNGQFIVYHSGNRNGEIANTGSGVASILQNIVLSKFPYIFDFTRGVTENQLKLTNAKLAAKCALEGKTSGVMVNVERFVLQSVWEVDEYWKKSEFSALPIVIIKKKIEDLIEQNFGEEGKGKIAISDIYNCLTDDFGFAPCNLSAFLCAFLIKEYSTDPYRYLDSHGEGGVIDQDKLSEMLKNYLDIKKSTNSWIVKMTPEEMAFYELTKNAWGITTSSNITTADQAAILVRNKMQALKLPVWTLELVDNAGVFDIIKKYTQLVQNEGPQAHVIANEIGGIAINRPSLAENLKKLISIENCKKGMELFLREYQEGKLLSIASEIGAKDLMINDIMNLFAVEYSSLWQNDTGKEQIENLYFDYLFVKTTNELLNIFVHSKYDAMNSWVDKLRFSMCSCEGLIGKYPELKNIWEFLLKIYQRNEILPSNMKQYTIDLIDKKSELEAYFNNENIVFHEMYSPYLEEIDTNDISKLKNSLSGIFAESKTRANERVKNSVKICLESQKKTQLFNFWKEKTGTKSPIDWSYKHRTPILRMVRTEEYDFAKKAFETLNRGNGTDKEIDKALEFLNTTTLFAYLANEEKIEKAFASILGRYKSILTDYEKVRDALDKLTIDAYDWDSHPEVRFKIQNLAKAEYDAGGSDRVVDKIQAMSAEAVKEYLINLIKDKVDLGLEILNGGE